MVHIGIIPDGNRRWAKQNNYNLNTLAEFWTNKVKTILKQIVEIIKDNKIKKFKYLNKIDEVSLYVCSIDNINRNDNTKLQIYEFIRNLFKIFEKPDSVFQNSFILELSKILENVEPNVINNLDIAPDEIKALNLNKIFENLNLNVIGDLDILPDDIQTLIKNFKNKCKGDKYTFNLALAYDYNKDILNFGRNENPNYNRKQSNIDIVFRSGGEKRISGFFPTKILYSELFFIKKLWPDVTLEDLNIIIKQFYKRNRRFGK